MVQSSMLLIMMHILAHAQYGMQFRLARFRINRIRIIEGPLYMGGKSRQVQRGRGMQGFDSEPICCGARSSPPSGRAAL